jgi:hypothetical protein
MVVSDSCLIARSEPITPATTNAAHTNIALSRGSRLCGLSMAHSTFPCPASQSIPLFKRQRVWCALWSRKRMSAAREVMRASRWPMALGATLLASEGVAIETTSRALWDLSCRLWRQLSLARSDFVGRTAPPHRAGGRKAEGRVKTTSGKLSAC